MKNKNYFRLYLIMIFAAQSTFVYPQDERDLVKGNLIQFNDNGAWCWYQDERAVIDFAENKMILGSDACGAGFGGPPRNGDVESVIYDLAAGISQKYTLKESTPVFYCDDHNAPAFLVRPDGKYLAMYAPHFNDTSTYFRIYGNGAWGPEQRFNWKTERPGGANFQTTYSNVYYLSAENRVYNFVRGNNKSPNLMVSSDMGNTWSYGGQLTRNNGVGYNNGYYRYWGNGIDRIDFVFTEYHPRDYNTSLYHGYIKNGKSYKSDGTLADDNIFDTLNIPTPADFTQIFAANTVIHGVTMSRCWNIDLMRYADGTITTIFKARMNDSNPPSNDPNHAFLYARYNGTNWNTAYLCKAGLKLFSSEQDYIGLGAVHPDDPNTIYVSTTYDPRDDVTGLGVHEIFKGVTSDNGVTWTWTPITEKSVQDNLRPIIPLWDEHNTALIWWRGTYTNAQTYDAAVVGIIERELESADLMTYTDASSVNTTFATGSPLVTTGPDGNTGASDNQWHERTGYGNGGSVYTSAESSGGENAPALKTSVTAPDTGVYDVWVNFWANPTSDWRIEAGFTGGNTQVYRQMASKQVRPGDHNTAVVLTGENNVFLYQAYIGRVELLTNAAFDVYIDDRAIQTGTSGTQTGNTVRTWYDGISFAKVYNYPVPVELAGFSAGISGGNIELNWETKTETNNYGFEIQRRYKAYGWITAGFVKGKGTTVEANSYSFYDKSAELTGKIYYRLKQVDFNGSFEYSDEVMVDILPAQFSLSQNYPNPFNPATSMQYAIGSKQFVTLKVYNVLGKEVSTLINEEKEAGNYVIDFNASNLPSGTYFYKLTAGKFSATKKMIVLK